MNKISKSIKQACSDKNGRLTLFQAPNLPLIFWALSRLFTMLLHVSNFRNGVGLLGDSFLFVWAYLEISEGDSLFRRILGTLVMGLAIASFFRG